MNKIIVSGTLKNIKDSHTIGDIEYSKANIIIPREDGKEDTIDIKFKKYTLKAKEGDQISFVGNLRTYSQKLEDRNKVSLYVYTYFDLPEEEFTEGFTNYVELDGFICKKSNLRKTSQGKDVIDFIIANNLETNNKMLNCYIPSVAWGKLAKEIDSKNIGDYITIKGRLQSREYKKYISENDYEIRIAHELSISEIN